MIPKVVAVLDQDERGQYLRQLGSGKAVRVIVDWPRPDDLVKRALIWTIRRSPQSEYVARPVTTQSVGILDKQPDRRLSRGLQLPQASRSKPPKPGKANGASAQEAAKKRAAKIVVAPPRQASSPSKLKKALSTSKVSKGTRKASGRAGRAVDDRQKSKSVRTVSGGLPTLGRRR